MSRDSGFTMVEMLVALAASTVLLTLSVELIHRAMDAHSTAARQASIHRESLRLSRQFRHDMRHAERVAVAERSIKLGSREFDGSAVTTYTLSTDGNEVIRQHLRRSDDRRIEAYRFVNLQLRVVASQEPSRVGFSLAPVDRAGEVTERTPLQILAVVRGDAGVISTERRDDR